MAILTLEDLRAFREKSTDRFRLETLPQYLVPQEEAKLAAWRQGDRNLETPETSAWLTRIRNTTATGGRCWRVRILDYPLMEYSRFELHGYQANAGAGEQVYVADRAWHPDLTGLHDDFWIYDHKVVLRMIYDAEGHFLHPELVEDETPYLAIRESTYQHAIPLGKYLDQREPSLIA